MSAIYMSQLSAALPLMEGDHHQDHHHEGHFQAFTLPKDPPILFPFVISSSSPSDSSLSYGSADHHLMRQHQAMLEPQHVMGSSAGVFATPFPTVESIRDDMIEPSSYDPYPYDMGRLQVSGSFEAGAWTPPAKMRITRKASGDPGAAGKKPRRRAQAFDDMGSSGMNSQANLGAIRVCSDCNTTKTPLWRSGPCGPKSLCNACGIRQRKARQAMMASGAAADGAKAAASLGDAAAPVPPKVKKEKRAAAADVDRSLPFKKRCKVVQDHAAVAVAAAPAAAAAVDKAAVVPATATAEVVGACRSRDLVDNIGLITWSRSRPATPSATSVCSSSRPSPAFPVQDEITDAAMLLMTLSCGLVRS